MCYKIHEKTKKERYIHIFNNDRCWNLNLNSPDFHITINTVCNGLTGQIHKHQTCTAQITNMCVYVCVFAQVKFVIDVLLRSSLLSWLFPPWSVLFAVRTSLSRWACSLLLLLLFVELQEEVVACHSKSSNQYYKLSEINLPVIVGVQVSHNLVHRLLILGILCEWGNKTEI